MFLMDSERSICMYEKCAILELVFSQGLDSVISQMAGIAGHIQSALPNSYIVTKDNRMMLQVCGKRVTDPK